MTKKTQVVEIFQPQNSQGGPIPVASAHVQAGFPSPADDFIEKQLDLNEMMIQHPAATFFVRVEGESMIDAGIQSGDILVVDRSLEPVNGKIVVAIINGEFTVKRLGRKGEKIFLYAENAKYPDICVEPGSDFEVWGIVSFVIHKAN